MSPAPAPAGGPALPPKPDAAPAADTHSQQHWAVVVTYFPDIAQLRRLLRELLAQAASVVVVDNGSKLPKALLDELAGEQGPQRLHWIVNADNLGIGGAQNQGIEHAMAAGADFITLLDQDSLPQPGMLSRLAAAWQRLHSEGQPVFAVGPRLVDEASGAVVPFIAYRYGLKQRIRVAACDEAGEAPGIGAVACFALLASGTTFHRSVLSVVGPLDAALFLEYVDIEWGARARSRGLRCYGVPSATLAHSLGDARLRLPAGLSLPLHSPIRHYYTFRNAVLMQKRGYVPLYWKIADLLRCLVTAPLFIAFDRQAASQARMILQGLRDGWLGRTGPFPARSSRTTPLPGGSQE